MGIPELKTSESEPRAPVRRQPGDWADSKFLQGLGAHPRSSWVRPGLAVCLSCSQTFRLDS